MCMATLIPANVDIPQEGLENGAVTNDDGHGYAIASAEHGMETFRSMEFKDTMDALLDARNRHGKNSVVLFHSRFGTHGEMGIFNVHPFEVGDETVMAHNGILPSAYHPAKGDRRSDTRIFVDRVAGLYCDNERGVPSRRAGANLGRLIGSGNKLAFLSVRSGKPAVRLVNSHLGESEGGVWYSNSGFRWSSRRSYAWWGDEGWRDDWNKGSSTVVGKRKFSDEEERCPMCYSWDIDLSANVCLDCDFCLDCEDFLDNCMCYLPTKAYADELEERGDDEALDILDIVDSADDGYVKVNGVWVWARSLIAMDEGTSIKVRLGG